MVNKKNDIYDFEMDEEEQEISLGIDKAIDKHQLKSVEHVEKKISAAKKAAANYFRKDARITLRLSNADLERLKQEAAYKGLPYQTFISSVLHEYAAGHFLPVKSK